MPVYDYKCPQHGLFHELGVMETSGSPCACPQCGTQSARIIMIPPDVLAMAPEQRKAMANNEKARHQPIISSTDSRAEAADQQRFALKQGDKQGGCCSQHRQKNSALKQQVVFLPDGSKVFPSQRPWMISH